MTAIAAAHLLLEGGWVSPGHIVCDGDGMIVSTGAGQLAGAADIGLGGWVVPGTANVHSHAHHRGLVGHADLLDPALPATLWSWRELMYRHALRLSPDDLEAYATLAYIEMLRRGYTAVGEFHYAHHDPSGARYARLAEMSDRIASAAHTAGIALTLLPALYTSNGIGKPLEPAQRRFTSSVDEYLTLVDQLDQVAVGDPLMRVGVAPHSLRAVRPEELAVVIEERSEGPVHIHAAERIEEVVDVETSLGVPPVAWLLANAGVDERWCVIHATHLRDDERRALAESGAVAGLCPLTEANLGDGRFPLPSYRREGGRIGVGTDANHLIDLPGELRVLEYGQRLHSHRRETSLAPGEMSVAAALLRAIGVGGAQALAQPIGAIRPGLRCDLVELDGDYSALIGQTAETVLDAWIFSSASDSVVRTVLVAGRKVVIDGLHPAEVEARQRAAATMRRLHDIGD